MFFKIITLSLLSLFVCIQSYGQITTDQAYVSVLESAENFKDMSLPSGGVIRSGHTIKFLIDKRNSEKPKIYFFNANYCESSSCSKPQKYATFHYYFAKKHLGLGMPKSTFNNNIYYTKELSDRQFIGGRIQSVKLEKDSVEKTVYGVRFIERDLISEEIVKFTMNMINSAFQVPEGDLAFVQNSLNHTVDTVKDWLVANNISVYTMEELMSNIPFIALNPGTAYGILKYFPQTPDDLEYYDLPVFDQVPLDLAVVAGTITRSFQDVGSHVNLKSKERGTPNMVLRTESEHERLKALDGKPVKLVVDYNGYTITELENSEIVFKENEKKLPSQWIKPSYSESKSIKSFTEICSSSVSAKKCLAHANQFGGKVAGLAFLAHKDVVGEGSALQERLGYRLTPLGFGVPLSMYKSFIKHNWGDGENEFAKKLNKLISTEMSLDGNAPLSTKEKRSLVREVRELFLNAEVPDLIYTELSEYIEKLKLNVAENYPGVILKKIKIRSSANTEDIDGFNGAGLHDSFSAKLENSSENTKSCTIVQKLDDESGLLEDKVSPKSAACALKGVFASLWSLRAVRERSFRRFDHRFARMGAVVQPVYKFRPDVGIAANSVLITRVVGAETVYGQQLSTQFRNGLVTNPAPETRSELLNITFQSDETNFGINVLQFAKPQAEEPAFTVAVMPEDKILLLSEIGRTVEKAYCRAKNDTYFPGRDCKYVTNSVKKPKALDMEFKYFDNGEVLVKQVRTFSGK